MNRISKTQLACGALALLATAISGCDNDNNRPLSTSQQVLLIAQQSDDASAPITINSGAFAFNNTTETGAPVTINR